MPDDEFTNNESTEIFKILATDDKQIKLFDELFNNNSNWINYLL